MDSQPNNNNNIKIKLRSTPEGRILLVGIAMVALYAVWVAIELFIRPEHGQKLISIALIDTFFGRAAAMAFGFKAGLSKPAVIAICATIETVLVLLSYPLFVFTFENLLTIKWLNNMFDRVHKAAEKNITRVKRYGFIGLFCFVWLPFWMTGPVVGCVIGYLIGMRIWVTMTAVIAGTCIAVTGWALFFEALDKKLSQHSPHATTVLVFALMIIICLAYLFRKSINRRKVKSDATPIAPPPSDNTGDIGKI